VESGAPDSIKSKNSIWFIILVILAMLIHPLMAYAHRPFPTTIALELVFGAMNFAAIVIMFYGINRLVYGGNYLVLAMAAAAAIFIGWYYSSEVSLLSILAGWGTILFSSGVGGFLASRNFPLARIYAVALLLIIVFSSLQMFPVWTKIISSASEISESLSLDLQESLQNAGYSQHQTELIAEQFKVFYAAFTRVLPAFSLMAIMFQFTIGLGMFLKWLRQSGQANLNIPEFLKIKMPFALTPVLMLGVLLRLLGNNYMTIAADNILLVLAVFYSIAGISLFEFYMKKFRFSMLSRIFVYLLFVLTHVIGFALLTLVGFVDSFFDWRRKYPLPLDYKTG